MISEVQRFDFGRTSDALAVGMARAQSYRIMGEQAWASTGDRKHTVFNLWR
jgi:hypothetical protein